jgi:uncharacterized protein (TIGR03435 family)
MRYVLVLTIVIGASTLSAAGQNTRQFDVASIRASDALKAGILRPFLGSERPGVWRAHDQSLVRVIQNAYPELRLSLQIIGAPDWAERELYNIEARTDPAATEDEVRQMVRSLLTERFKLAAHQEQRDVPAFVLVKRNGAKLDSGLKLPSVDCTAFRAGGPRPTDPSLKPNADRLPCNVVALPAFEHTLLVPGADWRITGGDVPISRVLTLLGNYLHRPVVDRTGLTQRFDIELQFVAEPDRPGAENGPSIRTAIAEQLGLQVQDGRTSVDVLVIDHIERSTEN